MNQNFLADVINWVGVTVGVLGAVIVAPSGFSVLIQQVIAAARRFLPSKPQHHTTSASLAIPIRFGVEAYGHVGIPPDLPDHELLYLLASRLDELSKTMLDVQKQFNDKHEQIRNELGRIEAGGQQSAAEIRDLIGQAELQSAQFNARGLPLIALGTLMTGPASILAESDLFGCVLVAVAICLMIYGVRPWLTRLFKHSGDGAAEPSQEG
jgi:hypothetical protein